MKLFNLFKNLNLGGLFVGLGIGINALLVERCYNLADGTGFINCTQFFPLIVIIIGFMLIFMGWKL